MNRPEWDTALPNEEIGLLFSQPYLFYKRGSQSYVFASKDGKYVLKIFSQPLRKQIFAKKGKVEPSSELQIQQGIDGYRLATQLPPKSTGLVYLHLNTTQDLLPSLQLQDALGRTHRIALDRYRFVLQRKSLPLASELRKMAKAGRSDEVKQLIESYLVAIHLRVSLGIRNNDTEFKNNFGLLDGKVIEFDFGEFVYDPSMLIEDSQKKELFTFTDRLRYWVGEHIPEYEQSVLEKMNPDLVVLNKNSWNNFGVKAAEIDDRKLQRIE